MKFLVKKKKFNDRQKEVIEAFKFAWKNYKKYAWGHDVLKPVAKSYKDDYHLGLSIVDSIDTMFLMDLKEGNRFIFQLANFLFVTSRH